MNSLPKRLIDGALFTYLTLVIMNSVKFIGIIMTIGSIGKLLFCLIFIASVLLFTNESKQRIVFLRKKEWIISISLLLVFSVVFILKTGTRINLLAGIAFPIYFIFYFLIIKYYTSIYRTRVGRNMKSLIKINILKIFRKALAVNFIIWLPLSIVLRAKLFEDEGGFGGFFEDEIHFGFYVVTGFLTSFYLRYAANSKDNSYYNTILLFVYGSIALFTSRNALLIVMITIIFYFLISKIKTKFYRIASLALTIILINSSLLFFLSREKISEITSGRYEIWLLALDNIVSKGFLIFGSGLFNLNDVILRENKGIGLYYLDELKTLSFHSSYLEMLASGGLILIICFFRTITKVWKLISVIDRSVIIGILTGALFESFLVQPFMLIAALFYFLLITNNTVLKFKIKEATEFVNSKNLIVVNRGGN